MAQISLLENMGEGKTPAFSPTVTLHDGRPATTSLAIAEHFGKRHTDVLRDIGNLVPNCPEEFSQRNFASAEYKDEQGKPRPMFTVFFDGFILLVMGYTGKQALQVKLVYIAEFNAMKEKLDRLAADERARLAAAQPLPADSLPEASLTLTASTSADREPLRAIVNAWSRISDQPQRNLWPQVRAAFNITNIKELPAEWVPDAIDWVQAKIDALNEARALPHTPPAPPAPRTTPPSLLASLVLPRFDEAPYREFIEECRRAHGEVNAILERTRNRAIKLSAPLFCEMQARMIAGGMTAGAAIDLTLEWHDHLHEQCLKALTYPHEDLPSYHNPAYALLKYVKALNG